MKFKVDFLICSILDYTILEIEFLSQQDRSVTCDKELLLIETKSSNARTRCADCWPTKLHRLLFCYQIDRFMSAADSNFEPSGSTGQIESLMSDDLIIMVTTTLCTLRAKQEVTVRCMNLGAETPLAQNKTDHGDRPACGRRPDREN